MNSVRTNWHQAQDCGTETNGVVDWHARQATPFPASPWREECLSASNPDSTFGESALLWFMLAVGLIPVVIAASQAVRWGVQPTCGLALMIFSAYQLIALRRSRSWALNGRHHGSTLFGNYRRVLRAQLGLRNPL